MRFVFEAHGEEIVSRDLLKFGEHAKNPRPVFLKIADDIRKATKKQFSSQGSLSGGWAKLAQSTVDAKRSAGLDPRILHATLELRDSLTQKGHPGQKVETSTSQLIFGTEIFYAWFHQSGTSRMPARPPVALDEPLKRAIIKRIQKWVVKGEL